MPIFISRYAPDRSLVGNFLFTRTRETEEDEAAQGRGQNLRSSRTDAAQAIRPGEDRVELSQSSPVDATRPPSQAGQSESGTAAPTPESGGAVPGASDAGTAQQALTLSIQQENRTASQSATQARVYTLLTRVPFQAETSAATRRVDADSAVAELGVERENVTALQSAQTGDPVAVAQALDLPEGESPLAEGAEPNGAAPAASGPPAETPVPQAAENPVTQDEAGQEGALQSAPPIPEPIPREIQEQELQRDLQTISTGLQTDAAIEGRRNVELAARTAERSAAQRRTAAGRSGTTSPRSTPFSRSADR